jgi:hypothetical protein
MAYLSKYGDAMIEQGSFWTGFAMPGPATAADPRPAQYGSLFSNSPVGLPVRDAIEGQFDALMDYILGP